MAYLNNTTASHSAFARIANVVGETATRIATSMHQRRLYRQTMNELINLTDRDLHDLGMCRSEIRYVAKEAAYGKRG